MALGNICEACTGDGHVEVIVATTATLRTAYPVAENGSYYGEISDLTGRPKTVHVGGYYRKDGTYVRGHYRSLPRGSITARGPPIRFPTNSGSYVSRTAENGSYYGQPNAIGRPKTVHVRGYYRKDGTYVRGHYRSKPRR